jgi:erythromycin 3''-O-methyltransferase
MVGPKWLRPLFYLIFAALVIQGLYYAAVQTYMTKDGRISYDMYIHQIQTVSKENFFMNYGFWESPSSTMREANERLVQILLEKSGLLHQTNKHILDVGCGYGEQDFYWTKQLDPSHRITALDISKKQIDHAKKHNTFPNVRFNVGDALLLDAQFPNETFDCVFNVESAFHYPRRPQFFRGVNTVLKPNGRFVLCDIVLADDYKPSYWKDFFIRRFCECLHVPHENLVSARSWEQDLHLAKFRILESHDITDFTFEPYYMHFFQVYSQNTRISPWITERLKQAFISLQPFAYRIAVCEKIA